MHIFLQKISSKTTHPTQFITCQNTINKIKVKENTFFILCFRQKIWPMYRSLQYWVCISPMIMNIMWPMIVQRWWLNEILKTLGSTITMLKSKLIVLTSFQDKWQGPFKEVVVENWKCYLQVWNIVVLWWCTQ